MEESEKRKERLKAMRIEASESGNYSESSSSLQNLENPLIDSVSTHAEVYARPRFDYYTDPMAAFSKNNNTNNFSPQVSQQPCFTPPRPRIPESPIYAARGNYSLDPRSQSQGVHHTFSPLGNPGGNSPFGTPQRNSPNTWGTPFNSPNNYVPPNSSTGGNFAGPGIHQGGRPGFPYAQGRGQPGSGFPGETTPFGTPQRHSPNTWGSPCNSPNSYIPPNSSPGVNFANPGIYRGGRPGSHYGQGRGQAGSGYRGSPFHGSGRGRGQWMGNNASPFSGQSDRRGLGSRERTSAESRPDLYYYKSMLEDPWKQLTPVIWKPLYAPQNSLDTPSTSKSWLPESISTKKLRSDDAPVQSTPQQSLAEYLAASLNEAVGKEAVNDKFGT